MAVVAFFVTLGVLVASVLCCYFVGYKAGERSGAKEALRNFMTKLKQVLSSSRVVTLT